MGIILPTYMGIIINHDKGPCINNQYDGKQEGFSFLM